MDSDSISKQNKAIAKEQLVAQLEDVPIVEVACRRAGVPRATYYRWLQNDPIFVEKCRSSLEHSTRAASDIAEAKLISAIQEGNMAAVSFWLRNRHPTYQTRVNVQGTINHRTETRKVECLNKVYERQALSNTKSGAEKLAFMNAS